MCSRDFAESDKLENGRYIRRDMQATRSSPHHPQKKARSNEMINVCNEVGIFPRVAMHPSSKPNKYFMSRFFRR